MDPYVPDQELLFIVWMLGVICMGFIGLMVGVALTKIIRWFVDH